MKADTNAAPPEETLEQDDAVIGTALAVSLAVFGVVALLVAGAVGVYYFSASVTPPAPPPAPPEVGKRQAAFAEVPQVPFTDITEQAGIRFAHTTGADGEKLLPETMGSGVAFLDYNNDGHQDLLFVNGMAWPWQADGTRSVPATSGDGTRSVPTTSGDGTRSVPATLALYQNDGRGNFTNVTEQSGLAISLYGMGAAVGDYDGDGWSDLFLTAVGHNKLLRNEEGKFRDVTDQAGVAGAEDAWSSAACWFDYDRDGRLDLFVCNYVKWSREIDIAQGFTLTGDERAYGPPLYFEGTLNYLYRNEGDGRFADVSESAGIHIFNRQQPEKKIPAGKALGVVPFDLDGDGWLDLVVANDTVQNFVFHNQKDGTFREIGGQAGMAFGSDGLVRGAMGIDIARPRNNDAVAVAIGNFSNEPTSFFVSQGEPKALQFLDESVSNGVGPQTRLDLTFAVLFLDYDLDGRLDLFAANGHLEEEINKVLPSQHYRQPPQLLWNAGADQPTEFVRVPADKVGEQFSQPLVGRGAAYADIDGDGDLDLVVTECGGRPRLLRNDQQLGHHWLRVKLQGRPPNPEALGAVVRLVAAGSVQERCVNTTRGYLSQSELPVTFGLGKLDQIDRLEITWPDGTVQEIAAPAADQMLVVKQAEGPAE